MNTVIALFLKRFFYCLITSLFTPPQGTLPGAPQVDRNESLLPDNENNAEEQRKNPTYRGHRGKRANHACSDGQCRASTDFKQQLKRGRNRHTK